MFRQVAQKRELQPLDLFGPPADGGVLQRLFSRRGVRLLLPRRYPVDGGPAAFRFPVAHSDCCPPAGFLFDGVLDAAAVTTLKAHMRLLQKLYKALVVSGELLVIQAHMRLLQKLYKALPRRRGSACPTSRLSGQCPSGDARQDNYLPKSPQISPDVALSSSGDARQEEDAVLCSQLAGVKSRCSQATPAKKKTQSFLLKQIEARDTGGRVPEL